MKTDGKTWEISMKECLETTPDRAGPAATTPYFPKMGTVGAGVDAVESWIAESRIMASALEAGGCLGIAHLLLATLAFIDDAEVGKVAQTLTVESLRAIRNAKMSCSQTVTQE